MIIDQLEVTFKECISTSFYMKFAVALINETQLTKLLENAGDKDVQIITGTDLNAKPSVLNRLYKSNFDVRLMLNDNKFIHYHPKVYLFSEDRVKWTGFVGSANLTDGGMYINTEMSIEVNESQALDLVNWFNTLFNQSTELTLEFIEKYELNYKRKKQWFDKINNEDEDYKKSLNESKLKASRDNLIENIKYILRESSENDILKNKGWDARDQILESLDAKNNYSNPDLDTFFGIRQLGKIRGANKVKIDIKEFSRGLQKTTLEDDVFTQFEILNSVKHIGKNIASKILCSKYPSAFFVWNGVSDILLKRHGIYFPKKLRFKQKYEFLNKEILSLAKEVNVSSMVAMDYIFYQLVSLSWNEYWRKFQQFNQGKILSLDKTFNGKDYHAIHIKSFDKTKVHLNGDSNNNATSIYVSIDFTGNTAKEDMKQFKEGYESQLRGLFPNETIEFDEKPKGKQALVRIRKYVPIFDRTNWESQFEWLSSIAGKVLIFIQI